MGERDIGRSEGALLSASREMESTSRRKAAVRLERRHTASTCCTRPPALLALGLLRHRQHVHQPLRGIPPPRRQTAPRQTNCLHPIRLTVRWTRERRRLPMKLLQSLHFCKWPCGDSTSWWLHVYVRV